MSKAEPAGERFDIRLSPAEAEIYRAHYYGSRFQTKATFNRACLMSGCVNDLDELACLLGEIGFLMNEINEGINTKDHRPAELELRYEFSKVLSKLSLFLAKSSRA